MSIRYQDPESLTSLGSIGFALVPSGFTPPAGPFDALEFLRPRPELIEHDSLLANLQDAWRHGVGMMG